MNGLELKTIYDLLGKRFYVPFYQRGYRWTETQVRQLLEDVWEFVDKKKAENEFYCLQPIVVRGRKDGSWELIDGQQRLTTIYLILKHIEKEHLRRPLKEAYNNEIFELEYEARPKVFLDEIDKGKCEKERNNNIDFYHICEAYLTIKKWFEEREFDYNNYNKFLFSFLAKEDKDNPVKVIWYEVDENADPVEIFTRLNIGKIPLTNAELIRALFLHSVDGDSKKPTSKQLQIASEWDEIENTLQKDEFWFYLSNMEEKSSYREIYDTRIEYIFDLIKERPKDAEDYYTFYKFYEDLHKNNKNIESLWREIKNYFYTFKEWYENDDFYHLTGYLIAAGKDIAYLKKEYDQKTKSEFKEFLRLEIKKSISDKDSIEEVIEDIKSLKYGDSNVKKVLLLFNILILLDNTGASIRFPFDKYKKEKWDIEHVFSQTDIELKGKALEEYAKLILEFWTGEKIERDRLTESDINKLRENLKQNDEKMVELFDKLVKIYNKDKNANDLFGEIKSDLIKFFEPDEKTKIKDRDSISNLVLLDSATNRAYKNSFFAIKRDIILNKIKNGLFVPVGTQNVFLKAYSKRIDNLLYWTQKDADGYLDAIVETFEKFFEQEDNNGEKRE